MTPEKFAVIGSNSFSGAHFISRLLKDEAEVVGISRSPEPSGVFLPYKWASYGKFRFYQLDLNLDLEKIMEVIAELQPDYVVNFASQSMVAQSWDSPEDWFMTNVVAMVKFHNRLRKCAFLKKYVHISTPEVYGNTRGLIKEDVPCNPSTPYAVSRTACDLSLMTFFRTYNFPVVFTRAANVCGPGQQLYRILPRTIFNILTGKKLRLEGGGKAVRSFIHIHDVCEGTLRATRKGRIGEIYHFATSQNITVRNLVEEVCNQLAVPFENCVEIVPPRKGQDALYTLDWTKAKTELGWQPTISLEATIAETIGWVKNNLGVLKEQPLEYVHKS
ncbi:MAG: GDP-mannose 4,6-dehydratase [Candidatus Omnitrophota bacterium]